MNVDLVRITRTRSRTAALALCAWCFASAASASEPRSAAARASSSPSAPSAPTPMLTLDPADAILARFEREPSIAEVQEETTRFASLEPKRAASWRSRVRKAPWLPEVTVRVLRGMEDDLLSNANGQTHALSDDLAVEVRARWRFDRLVFDRNELSVSRESTHVATLRHELAAEATRIYFQRRRLQLDLALAPPQTAAARARRLLQLDELTAELDALTGGWFRRQLRRTK